MTNIPPSEEESVHLPAPLQLPSARALENFSTGFASMFSLNKETQAAVTHIIEGCSRLAQEDQDLAEKAVLLMPEALKVCTSLVFHGMMAAIPWYLGDLASRVDDGSLPEALRSPFTTDPVHWQRESQAYLMAENPQQLFDWKQAFRRRESEYPVFAHIPPDEERQLHDYAESWSLGDFLRELEEFGRDEAQRTRIIERILDRDWLYEGYVKVIQTFYEIEQVFPGGFEGFLDYLEENPGEDEYLICCLLEEGFINQENAETFFRVRKKLYAGLGDEDAFQFSLTVYVESETHRQAHFGQLNEDPEAYEAHADEMLAYVEAAESPEERELRLEGAFLSWGVGLDYKTCLQDIVRFLADNEDCQDVLEKAGTIAYDVILVKYLRSDLAEDTQDELHRELLRLTVLLHLVDLTSSKNLSSRQLEQFFTCPVELLLSSIIDGLERCFRYATKQVDGRRITMGVTPQEIYRKGVVILRLLERLFPEDKFRYASRQIKDILEGQQKTIDFHERLDLYFPQTPDDGEETKEDATDKDIPADLPLLASSYIVARRQSLLPDSVGNGHLISTDKQSHRHQESHLITQAMEEHAQKTISRSREHIRSLGLMCVGGKLHTDGTIDGYMLAELHRRFGTYSTMFRLEGTSRTLVLPVRRTALEVQLHVAALQVLGLYNEAHPELQVSIGGRLQNFRAGVLGASMLLATNRGVEYRPGAFSTSHNDKTGARIMAYDDGVRVSGLEGDVPGAHGRTDMLGRRTLEDLPLYQLLGTLAVHAECDGPLRGVWEDYQSAFYKLLTRSGLRKALDMDPWVLDPRTREQNSSPEQHEAMIRTFTDSWFRSQEESDGGVHMRTRGLLGEAVQAIKRSQKSLSLSANKGKLLS